MPTVGGEAVRKEMGFELIHEQFMKLILWGGILP